MFIRYIYIEEYEDIIKNQNINFKWKYNFKFENKEIEVLPNNDYLEGIYKKYENIDDLTAIIGKNTSGKSSILRAMNIIFTEINRENNNSEDSDRLKFIAIFSKENNVVCYHNMPYDISIKNNNDITYEVDVININKNIVKDINNKYIYYSGIFDKNISLKEDSSFIDISSNNLLRKSIDNTYDLKIKRLLDLQKVYSSDFEIDFIHKIESEIKKYDDSIPKESLEKIKSLTRSRLNKLKNMTTIDYGIEALSRAERESNQFDLIDEFRRTEILKKMNYYSNDIVNNRMSENKLLFKFPDKIYINFADNFNIKDEFKMILKSSNETSILSEFITLIEQYTLDFSGKYYQSNNSEENMIIQFSILMYYELIEKLLKNKEYDIFSNIDEFLLNIHEKGINKEVLKEYINKLKLMEVNLEDENSPEEIEIKLEYNENEVTVVEAINNLISILDYESEEDKSYEIYNDILDEYKNKNKVKDKLDFITHRIDSLISYLNYLFLQDRDAEGIGRKFASQSSSSKDLDYGVIQIDKCIDNIKDIIPTEESLGIGRYNNIIYRELLYDDSDENDTLIELYDQLREELLVIIEVIESNKEKRYIKRDKLDSDKYNSKFIDADDEIIKEIDNVLYIINLWENVVNNNKVVLYNNHELTLESKWGNSEVLEFINIYNEMDITSFKIEYESEKLSSGQIVYFELQYRIYNILEELKDSDIILLIDEADIYLHPEIQIDFMRNTLDFIVEFLKNNNVQIIITSNSPFIISDIPNSKIIYIERDEFISIKEGEDISSIRTLGAPINDLLMNSFFMEKGIVGTLGQEKINELIGILYGEDDNFIVKMDMESRNNLYQTIDSIGDSIIRYKLISRYNTLIKGNKSLVLKQIQEYKQMIKELEEGI